MGRINRQQNSAQTNSNDTSQSRGHCLALTTFRTYNKLVNIFEMGRQYCDVHHTNWTNCVVAKTLVERLSWYETVSQKHVIHHHHTCPSKRRIQKKKSPLWSRVKVRKRVVFNMLTPDTDNTSRWVSDATYEGSIYVSVELENRDPSLKSWLGGSPLPLIIVLSMIANSTLNTPAIDHLPREVIAVCMHV